MEQWIRRNPFALAIALLGLQVGFIVARKLYKIRTGYGQDEQVLPSPIKRLSPKPSPDEPTSCPYPPDTYPGSRDVESPYGSLRVYEWGSEEGRKVLLVHGIATPCIALGAVAHGLADKGCRVMMVDLPGRGYSDTPVPTPHSNRLHTTTILLALSSSSLPWTGNGETFSLIGLSLGGGIVANFASYFPTLVSSLVLLAPSGLVRPRHATLMSKLLYNTGLIDEATLEAMIINHMRRGETPSVEAGVQREMEERREGDAPLAPPFSRIRPEATVLGLIPWQVENHAGYVKSFISSVRYGPISGQHEDWHRIAKRLNAQNASTEKRFEKQGLQNGKVLIIVGDKDDIIDKDELVQDATEILGENNVRFEIVDAGHELSITKSREVVDLISAFWKDKFSRSMS